MNSPTNDICLYYIKKFYGSSTLILARCSDCQTLLCVYYGGLLENLSKLNNAFLGDEDGAILQIWFRVVIYEILAYGKILLVD